MLTRWEPEAPDRQLGAAMSIRGESIVPTVTSNSDITEVAGEVDDAPITDRLAKVDRDPLFLGSLLAALGQYAGQQDVDGCSGLADVGLERWKRTRINDKQLDRRGRFVDIVKPEGVRHNVVTVTATGLEKRPRRNESRKERESADTYRWFEKQSQGVQIALIEDLMQGVDGFP